MSFLNWRERWELVCRLKLKERFSAKAACKSPKAFRRELRLSECDSHQFHTRIQPWQQTDFQALDSAWQQLASHGEAKVKTREPESAGVAATASRFSTGTSHIRTRAYIERPRGHAKTSDMAIQIAWILLFARYRLHGLAAAADRDQATLIWDAVRRIAVANPRMCADLQFRKHLIVNPRTDSRLEIISSDVQSSWGALPDFVICDELCHWEKPDIWFSLFSSAAKRPDCVLVVLTNAGVGRGWQWEVREAARNSKAWYFSTLDGAQAPWIAPAALREQQELLPRPVFDRLWQNRWQHSDGEFVTLEEAEACRNSNLAIQHRGQPQTHYVAAVDYAEKHDYTVGVIVHAEQSQTASNHACDFADRETPYASDKIVVDRMDVAVPTPNNPIRIAWVENWIIRTLRDFHNVTFILDEYQLLGTIQKMETRANIHRFEFAAGKGNHALALNLRRLIIHKQINWYPHCGQLPATSQASDTSTATAPGSQPSTPDSQPPTRDDLETELASLLLKQSPSGRIRIDHLRDNQHHDDRAFALGAACLHLAQSPTGNEWLQITPPTTHQEFNF